MVSRPALHAILTFIRCIEQVTVYFLKDLMFGAKTSKYIGRPFSCDQLDIEIKAKESRHISVPYYDTLTIKTILAFLDDGHKHVYDYLPDLQELDKISREWICNVCYTVLQDEFADWVKLQIKNRNEEVIEKGELAIEMDAEVFAAFQASTSVSCKFYFLSSSLNP